VLRAGWRRLRAAAACGTGRLAVGNRKLVSSSSAEVRSRPGAVGVFDDAAALTSAREHGGDAGQSVERRLRVSLLLESGWLFGSGAARR